MSEWRFEPTLSNFIIGDFCTSRGAWVINNALGTLDSQGPTLHFPHLSRGEWKFSSVHSLYAKNSRVCFSWLSTFFFFLNQEQLSISHLSINRCLSCKGA